MDRHHRFHGHRLRNGRCSQPGRAYMVTAVTRDRRPLFTGFRAPCAVARSLHHMSGFGHRTFCFVVMPDHVHWLVQLGYPHDLSTTVSIMKSLSARRIGMSIWQRGFHDHAVRDGEDIREMARYIVGNPVRAGIVETVRDYPFWDAVWLDRYNDEVW